MLLLLSLLPGAFLNAAIPADSLETGYTSRLENDPGNESLRMEFIRYLLTGQKYAEARNNLLYLEPNMEGNEEFLELKDKTDALYRDRLEDDAEHFSLILDSNPGDGDAAGHMVKNFLLLGRYNDAESVLANYLSSKPEDHKMRLLYADILFRENKKSLAAEEIARIPDEYRESEKSEALRALIETDAGEPPPEEVIENNPAILAMMARKAYLEGDPDNLNRYFDILKDNFPDHPEVASISLIINYRKENGDKAMLARARTLFEEGECGKAAGLYSEYLDNNDRKREILIEAANSFICDSNYIAAASLYEEALGDSSTENEKTVLVKLYMKTGRYLDALDIVNEINAAEPENTAMQELTGDVYRNMGFFKEARERYELIKDNAPDPYKVYEKISGLPETARKDHSLFGSVTGIEKYIRNGYSVTPAASFYSDNRDYNFYYAGLQIETSWLEFVSGWLDAYKGKLQSPFASSDYSSAKGGIKIFPLQNVLFAAGMGQSFYSNDQNTIFVSGKGEYKSERIALSAGYKSCDASYIFESPLLVSNRLPAVAYNLDGTYTFPSGLRVFGSYKLYSLERGEYFAEGANYSLKENIGNDFSAGIGFLIRKNIYFGYGYFYSDFRYTVSAYYSPQEYTRHSVWAEWLYPFHIGESLVTLKSFGETGYITSENNLMARIGVKAEYFPFERINILLSGYYEDDSRYGLSYRSGAFSLTAGYSVF